MFGQGLILSPILTEVVSDCESLLFLEISELILSKEHLKKLFLKKFPRF
jgi:hypothetical protein